MDIVGQLQLAPACTPTFGGNNIVDAVLKHLTFELKVERSMNLVNGRTGYAILLQNMSTYRPAAIREDHVV